MTCPKCEHIQTCPCTSCQNHNPTEKPWIHLDGDFVKCGNCEFKAHCDWWLDREMEFLRASQKLHPNE